MCPSTTTGFGSTLPIPAAGPRKPGGGCFSNRRLEKPRPQETHDPKPGLTFLFPPVLTEYRENAVGRATDGNGNQASFPGPVGLQAQHFPGDLPDCSAASSQTKPQKRWLPRYCLRQHGDPWLRKSLFPSIILGVSRLHDT